MPSIAELVAESHKNACEKGFWTGERENVGEHLALISTEIMEFEDTVSFEQHIEELADIVIRVFDLCGYLSYELPETVLAPRAKSPVASHEFAHKAYRHVARATQCHRKGDKAGARCWLGSLISLCVAVEADNYGGGKLEEAIRKKMAKNRERPMMHGRLY